MSNTIFDIQCVYLDFSLLPIYQTRKLNICQTNLTSLLVAITVPSVNNDIQEKCQAISFFK